MYTQNSHGVGEEHGAPLMTRRRRRRHGNIVQHVPAGRNKTLTSGEGAHVRDTARRAQGWLPCRGNIVLRQTVPEGGHGAASVRNEWNGHISLLRLQGKRFLISEAGIYSFFFHAVFEKRGWVCFSCCLKPQKK